MATAKIGQQKAEQWLLDCIKEYRKKKETRLPTISDMALSCGVAPVTFWKVVRKLTDQGVLQSSHKKGIIILKGPIEPTTFIEESKKPTKTWERVTHWIERDILKGTYQQGTVLPSTKELSIKYGVCYRTLLKSLSNLLDKGLIVKSQKVYKIPLSVVHRSRNKIILITRGDTSGTPDLTTPRTLEHLRILENECTKRNLTLEILTSNHEQGVLFPIKRWQTLLRKQSEQKTVIGFMLWPLSMLPSIINYILDSVVPFSQPISVLDEIGEQSIQPRLYSNRLLRVVSIAQKATGTEQIGRYLLNLGHKSIAFISPYHQETWSLNRLRGLIRVYESAGLRKNVHVFVTNYEIDNKEYQSRLLPLMNIFKMTTENQKQVPALDETHLRILEALRIDTNRHLQQEMLIKSLMPLYKAALEHPDITAWVAVSDPVAVDALKFLTMHKIRVPEQISLIGMDNSTDSYLHKITSYNFNSQAVVQSMLSHILDHSKTPFHREPIEIEGFLNIRESTGVCTNHNKY